MIIRDVSEVLANVGLRSPDLELLRPNENRYTCLLLQPSGPIFAGRQRIGLHERGTGARKADEFLTVAIAKHAHLAVAPEYFFPWDVLEQNICNGRHPEVNSIWVLGCESIDKARLVSFKANVHGHCTVLHEEVDGLQEDRNFFDPIALIFHALDLQGNSHLVVLIQFKTAPSRDDLFFEEGVLRCGTCVYKFKGPDQTLSLTTINCSDAFGINDALVSQLTDRATLLHVQLNPDPRNTVYRKYRKTTFETDPDTSNCHIVCLNWAGGVVQFDDSGNEENWPAEASSAWYCPDSRCKCSDDIVLPNHNNGLYYTYMEERRHALMFHYSEAIFELLVPKVTTRGNAVQANRNGPTATNRLTWNANVSQWEAAPITDAGFTSFLAEAPDVANALADVLPNASPIDIERLLAISSGAVNGLDGWHNTKELDSCRIKSDEVVRRVTVAQDGHADARSFRWTRAWKAAEIRNLIDTNMEWPPQVADITHAASIRWSMAAPQFNVRGADGRPALIVYLGGDGMPARDLEKVTSKLTNLLRSVGGPYQRRICIAYRTLGHLKFAPMPFTRFDDAMEDETDILTVQP